jgi:serine/threonine-protein kinase
VHSTAADPLIGRTLEGRYRIRQRIARGGMSTVYSAMDERLDRLVAVKVMSAALSADPAFTDRFAREARAAARLSNLNTVSVYDQGIDDSQVDGAHVFLVMELVEGRTLRDLIRERGPLSVAQAVSIMEPVLSALAAAHRAGIVHRDVKPENILLSDDGVVKVADFGLARAVEAEAASTRTGLMMGTVAYCAPEQISTGNTDQRSDVYAAGVVFFELLTGGTPYAGDTAMTIAYQHVHSRVPAPSSRLAGVPEPIDELVVAATDRDPAGRPADAAAFLAELADVRTELALPVLPVPSRPRDQGPGTDGLASRSVDLNTTAALGGVAARHDTSVVADRGAPPPPVVIPPGRGQPPPRPPRPPRSAASLRRRRTLIVLAVLVVVGLVAGYGGWWLASGRFGRIPNVVGASPAVATTQLRHAGYTVSATQLSDFSETVPAGQVMGTDPKIGSRKSHGTKVELVLSKGAQRFTVPGTVNHSVDGARNLLAAIPVQIADQTEEQNSTTVRAGSVIGTDPPAGSSVKQGTTITIIVSSGPPIHDIPAPAPGSDPATATKALEDAGFKVKQVGAFDDNIPKGRVVGIDPTGQATVGTTITLTVSNGPSTVVIPNFADLTPLDQVRTALEQLGLKVKVVKAFGGHANEVVGLDPASGTPVPVGSTVTVTVV